MERRPITLSFLQLCHLAATGGRCGFQNDSVIKGANPQMSASRWASVETLVIFPNTMTHKEIFGCFCEKSGWKDGIVAKVLRDLDHPKLTSSADAKRSNQTPVMKWLVLDRNPVGQPCWLDYLTTLYSSEDPSLYLPSGELLPSHLHLKLLMEVICLMPVLLQSHVAALCISQVLVCGRMCGRVKLMHSLLNIN